MDEEKKTEEVKEETATTTEAPVQAPTEAPAGKDVEIPAKFKDIVATIDTMSVLDLHELVKVLEAKFGVSAAAVAVAGAAAPDAGAGEESETVTVVLASAGDQKIGVMKVVKEALALGLKEAKDIVDSAPATIKEGMKRAEADELKKKIEEAGGKVDYK